MTTIKKFLFVLFFVFFVAIYTLNSVYFLHNTKPHRIIPRATANFILNNSLRIYSLNSFAHTTETVQNFKKRVTTIPPKPGTIFISLASYRDEYCDDTLSSLFTRADDPSRVHVGVIDQTKQGVDSSCGDRLHTISYRQNVKILRMASSAAAGPTYARYLASKLWEGEEFFLQIDSHSKFAKHWDSLLLNASLLLPKKALFTHYPLPGTFTPPYSNRHLGKPGKPVPWVCAAKIQGQPDGFVFQYMDRCREENQDAKGLCVSPFIGAGFLFGRSAFLAEVPFDPYLPFLFQGEELLLAARLWTSGYDFFTPPVSVVVHRYGGDRENLFRDRRGEFEEKIEWARDRARFILNYSRKVPRINTDITGYGLGSERSIEEYFAFAGLNFTSKETQSRCDQKYDRKSGEWKDVTYKRRQRKRRTLSE